MKRIITILLTLALVLALVGCSANSSTNEAAAPTEKNAVQTEETKADTPTRSADSKALVVYFSRTGEQYGVGVIEKGNTAIVADMIIEQTGADRFEILPKNDTYPMTYKELTDVAKEEQNQNARPEIASTVGDLSSYDTIYLGYPIWWGDLPMICYTFLESYNFSGKTIIPFCTHEGSGDAGTQSKIQSAVPNADVKEVLAIKGTDTQNDPDSVRSAVTDRLNGMK